MKELLIFPYNGNGLEAIDCLSEEYELIGFIDDTLEKQGLEIMGCKVYSREALNKYRDAKVLAVPGSPASYIHRKKIIDSLELPSSRFATIVHPSSHISGMAKIGYNVLIMAGVVITSNAIINDHVCILPNSVIHHNVEIGEFSLIGSCVTVAGNTKVGSNCYIGSGTKIINNITIGKGSLVGLGSNVISNLPEYSKSVGNPARIIGNIV
ncbi:MAG TPA: NeuD/PglB/VioB family sugar acetyltransferase [Candidatus Eremiobacteraeota bacterium]|nr:NeuD/PglB/VioB family sugar acetyltransferase [Candidatus Eremiobacteraeota bacterium]